MRTETKPFVEETKICSKNVRKMFEKGSKNVQKTNVQIFVILSFIRKDDVQNIVVTLSKVNRSFEN
jgi:hypothetical protein